MGILTIATLAIVAFGGYKLVEDPTNQFFGQTVTGAPAGSKVVALTFDDGPNPPYTDEIADVLAREHVKATFFVVGRAVVAYPRTFKRIVHDGHAIGNHSWDHAHLVVLSRKKIRAELGRTADAMRRIAGVRAAIMRPPFGARDWAVLDEARRAGYRVVMWSVPLPRDWQYPGAATIASRVLRAVHEGSIIVLHDGNRGLLCAAERRPPRVCDRGQDVEATRLIVEALKKRGYRFVTIPQLIALHERGAVPKHRPVRGSE